MLKKLLYLYNDGHNPFPKLGKGGLGYHLPQYHKRMYGDGLILQDTGQIDWDGNDDDLNVRSASGFIDGTYTYNNGKFNIVMDDGTTKSVGIQDTRLNLGHDYGFGDNYDIHDDDKYEGDDYYEVYNYVTPITKTQKLLKDIETTELPKTDKLSNKYVKEINDTIKKAEQLLKTPTQQKVIKKAEPEPDTNVKKMTLKEKAEHKKNIITDLKFDGKKPAEALQIYNLIIKNHPNITYEDFKSNPTKYKDEFYNQKHENQEKMETIKKSVLEEHDKEMTATKGHAAEVVLLRDYQTEIKQLTGSTDPTDIITMSSESDGFLNNDGVVPMVKWKNDNGETVLKPISDFSLYDAGGKKATIDLKYYNTEDVDVQYSKIVGAPSFIPLYRELNGKIKLYNVVCRETKKLINKYNDTDTYIIAKTPSSLSSWEMTDFIKKNINKSEIKTLNYKGIECFTINQSFMERMLDEKKIKKGKTHKGEWFSINTKKMNKK